MKFTKGILALLLAGCISLPVYAANIYDVKYDVENSTVTIKGSTPGAYSNVTFEILKNSRTSSELADILPENAEDVVVHFDQCEADENGDYEITFGMPSGGETGECVTRVSWGSGANESTMVYISYNDYQNALSAVNSASSNQDMVKALDDGIKYMGVQNPYYEKLTSAQKLALVEDIIEKKEYSGTADFGAAFYEALAIQTVNHCPNDGVEASDVFDYFKDELNLSALTAYTTYEKQTDSTKKNIADAVAIAKTFNTIAEIRNAFEEQVVLCSLYYASGYDVVYDILSANNYILGIDFSDYNKLSSKSEIDKKMIGTKFTSVKNAADAFKSYVEAASKTSDDSDSSRISGSSGGGSSSKASAVPMTSYNPQSMTDNKQDGIKTEFDDIDSVLWAKDSIEHLAEFKIVSGKGDGKFAPNDSVKREEFVTMLVLALDIYDEKAECVFSDTQQGKWYYAYVASGVKEGLVNGMGSNLFGTGNDISKQDIAALLYRAALLKGITLTDAELTFNDENEISSYARESVRSLYASGIISGNGSGSFEPKKSATRAETAVMIDRLLSYIK